MPLTLDQAAQAGVLAAQAAQLNANIASLQAAIGAGAQVESIVVTANMGPQLSSNLPLSQADTATLLNAALTIYQTMLASVTSQLRAMG